jgi:hypothetical protein
VKVLSLAVVVLSAISSATGAVDTDKRLPKLIGEVTSTVTVTNNAVTVIFGPLQAGDFHDDQMPAQMQKHVFMLEKDVTFTGYELAVFTKDGIPLPRHYLHHLSLWDMSRKSTFCPGAPYNFAGAGNELTHARFPAGYGVKLKKGSMILAVAHFYHDAPPVKDVMASITLVIAPDQGSVHPMEVYHVSVNTDCHTKLSDRPKDESDEGIQLNPGLMIRTAPVKFRIEGCVKAAYPHGHDQLALITLEDKTTEQTLLRTVPTVASDGSFLGFASHQVFEDDIGFSIEADHEYEMTMIYHQLLHDETKRYGMADYLMYLTPGKCNLNSHAVRQ